MDNYNSLILPNQDQLLSDYSESDKPWDRHKQESETVYRMLATSDNDRIRKYADRIKECAGWLIFAHTDLTERKFRLHQASFCRVRVCPVCQWRRSMKYTCKMIKSIPEIVKSNPRLRLLHLVLTVRNCPLDELRQTINLMNTGWNRLTRRKQFIPIVKGYLKSIEITHNSTTDEAHPHFHCLLLVPDWYFTHSNYYLTHSDWTELWKSCCRLEYIPIVNIQSVRQSDEKRIIKIVRELTKYTTKPDDLINSGSDWLIKYIFQTIGLRFFSTGGLIRQSLGEIEKEYENLINVDEDETDNDKIIAQSLFDWNREREKYIHSGSELNPKLK